MDRSDPSENASYGQTFILPMAKLRHSTEVESIVLKGQGLQTWQMSDGRWIDRIHRRTDLTVGHLFYQWRNDVILQMSEV